MSQAISIQSYNMILSPSETQKRIVSGIISILLILIGFIILKTTKIPETPTQTERYQKIDWTKFTPPPIQPEMVEPEEPTAEQVAEAPKQAEPVKPIKRLDLSSIMKMTEFSAGDLISSKSEKIEIKIRNASSSNGETTSRINLSESGGSLSGFNLPSSDDQSFLSLLNDLSKSKDNDESGAGYIKLVDGNNYEKQAADFSSGSDGLEKGMEAKAPYGTSLNQVSLKKLSDLGEDYQDFSPLYIPIVEWMKGHPAEFPQVVKRFMEYIDGNLTSIINFVIDEKQYLMFLLCKEKAYEVRISLIYGNSIIYLIDQGFKKESHYLRTGSVERKENSEILSFGSTRIAASHKANREFYQVFLSWWETVKDELEEP